MLCPYFFSFLIFAICQSGVGGDQPVAPYIALRLPGQGPRFSNAEDRHRGCRSELSILSAPQRLKEFA